MEGGNRRQRWNNYNNRKPAHSSFSHPNTVPSWEKDFCKFVGCFDWYTLVQMKKCTHFYDNVISWNDSAGEEAFHNAKRRYWAQIKGIQSDAPLPDPDLYIQNIDWNSEITPDSSDDLDSGPVSPKSSHEPVVIFGDMFYEDKGFSPTGWGDIEKSKFPVVDNNHGNSREQNLNWGESWYKNVAPTGWTDGDDNDNDNNNNNNTSKNVGPTGWTGCDEYNNSNFYSRDDSLGRKFGWGDNNGGWGYGNYVGPYGGEGRGYGNSRVDQGYGDRKNHTWRGGENKGRRHNRGSYNRGRQDKRPGPGLREQGSNYVVR